MRPDPHRHQSLIGGGHRRATRVRRGRLRCAAKICCSFLALAFVTGWAFAQTPRGYRTIDQSSGTAIVGIGIEGELESGQVVLERLPQDVLVVGEVQALRLIGFTAANEPITEIVTGFLPPPIPDGEFSLQEFQFASEGVTGFSYTINRLLEPGEMITGDVAGGSNPGLIDNVWDDANNPILDQLENLRQRLFSAINIVTCTAFSVIPGGSSSSFNSECFGQASPRTISFDDRPGAFILGDLNASRSANEGESRVSIALGSTATDACKNQVEQGFIASTFTPAVRGLYRVGEAFTVTPNDSRNNGKKAKAEVTITGGGTASNPFAFEGLVETFSTNPFPCPIPPQPPIVYPSGAAVSDRVEVMFGTGQGTAFSLVDTRAVNSSFNYSLTAAPCTCECSEDYPDGAFTETFTTEIMASQVFESRAFACSAAITIGSAGSAYDFTGGPKDLLACFVLGIIAPECLDILPDVVSNQDGKGLRFETVTVDFLHQDLQVNSVTIDDLTPLDGVIAIISAEVENIGIAPAEEIEVKLFDNGIFRGIWVFPVMAAGQKESLKMAWDTTGLFGGGPRTLTVEVISRVTAELEYGNNTNSLSGVKVQPSVKAAFISTDNTVAPACSQCGEVQVYDTQTWKHIGSIDINAQLSINSPDPQTVGVPSAGTTAWVVLGNDGSGLGRFGLLGIDVLTCYSGTCQPLGSVGTVSDPTPISAAGGLTVKADGNFAFIPYNDNGLNPRIAIFPISSSGPGSSFSSSVPNANSFFEPTNSSIVDGVTGNMKEQVYIAGAHIFTGSSLRVYSIDAGDASSPPVSVQRFDVPLPISQSSSGLAVALSANITQELDPTGMLVDVVTLGAKGVVLDSGHRINPTYHSLLIPCPTGHPDDDPNAPEKPCLDGQASIPTTDFITELVASRDGQVAASTFANSLTTPDRYWVYDPSLPISVPVTSLTPGPCAGTPPLCNGTYQDLDVGYPVSRGSSTPTLPEMFLVDRAGSGGEADVFTYPLGPPVGGFSTGVPTSAITIAPIPLNGSPCYFFPPIPFPDPIPIPWPSGVTPNFNLMTMDPLQEIQDLLIPIIGCLNQDTILVLDFLDLPSDWSASWNPGDLGNVPPWDEQLDSLLFLPVLLTPAADFRGHQILTARVYPQGEPPADYATMYLRVERAPCVEALYGTDDVGQNLYTIDPTTGSAALVGNMGIHASALASDPVSGGLYAGTDFGLADLYKVDPATGEPTLIGDVGMGIVGVRGMSFDDAGTLYAAVDAIADGGTGGDSLAIINTATGVGVVVGPFGGNVGLLGGPDGIEGISFDPSGLLYGASADAGDMPTLYTIDTASGAAAPVAPIRDAAGDPPAGGVTGLGFDADGTLYGGTGAGTGDLIEIDPASGLYIPIGNSVAGTIGGLAFSECLCLADADCDDGIVCNGSETCDSGTGQCLAGTPPDCDDLNPCTVDSCDEASLGCVNDPLPDNTSCEDGLFCNGMETCQAGLCTSGAPVTCDDMNLCTMDSCDEGTNMCVNTPGTTPGPLEETVRVSRDPATGVTAVNWDAIPGAVHFNTYRGQIGGADPGVIALEGGRLLGLAAPSYNHVCFESADEGGNGPTTSEDPSDPPVGTSDYYLIAGENECGDGSLGNGSDATPRPNENPCPTPP